MLRRSLLIGGSAGLILPAAAARALTPAQQLILFGGSGSLPSWLPTADGVAASNFADYRTEGAANQYWNAGAQQANAAAWWASRGTGGTFARASSKFGPAVGTGTLTSFAMNVRAFVSDPGTLKNLGWSAEGARTNIFTHSQQADLWTQSVIGAVVTADTTTAPDGTLTGDTITFASGGTDQRANQFSGSGANTYTGSMYLQGTAGQKIGLRMYADSGSGGVASTLVTLTSSWQRYNVTGTFTSGSLINLGLDDRPGVVSGVTTTGVVLQAWGAQLEAASFPSSYIATTAGSVTRSADSQSLTLPSAMTAMSILLPFRTAPGFGGSSQVLYELQASGSNNLYVEVTTGGHLILLGDTIGTIHDFGVVSANSDHLLAFGMDGSGYVAALDGAAAITGASPTLPSAMTTEYEGRYQTTGSEWYGSLKGRSMWTSYKFSGAAATALTGSSYWN